MLKKAWIDKKADELGGKLDFNAMVEARKMADKIQAIKCIKIEYTDGEIESFKGVSVYETGHCIVITFDDGTEQRVPFVSVKKFSEWEEIDE